MSELILQGALVLSSSITSPIPALVAQLGDVAVWRHVELFMPGGARFLDWCDVRGSAFPPIRPVTWPPPSKGCSREMMASSVKQQLAAIRMFAMTYREPGYPGRPLSSVRGPMADICRKAGTSQAI